MINPCKLPKSEFGFVKHYQTQLGAYVYAGRASISHIILDSES